MFSALPINAQTALSTSYIVVVDPGHGGSDAGITATNLLKEKDVDLDLAEIVKKNLAVRPEITVFLTRSDDSALSNTSRAVLANRLKANLFISIHCGELLSPSSNGFEIFLPRVSVINPIGRTNASVPNFSLWENPNPENMEACIRFSKIFQDGLSMLFQKIQPQDAPCPFLGAKQSSSVLLDGLSMPAVVLEIGNLTNQKQAALLNDEAYKQELGRSIALAIEEFYIKR